MNRLSAWMLLAAASAFLLPNCFGNDDWPQWRGPQQNGVADGKAFPKEWHESAGVAWKTELPGKGGSTPIASGSTIYVTSGLKTDEESPGNNVLFAIDFATGQEKWNVAVGADTGGKHKKGSGSNPSPVVDGDLIFAYFRSGDLGCVDKTGELKWELNLQEKFGEDTLWWDLGSSPTLTKSAVIVAVMQSGTSYLVALDKKSGDVIWKVDRMLGAPEEAAQSYATPIVVNIDGEEVIAVMGADHLTLHDAASGKELGRLGGFNPAADQYFRSISSPVALGNIIVCPYARGDTITAVRMDELIAGKGKDAIAWFRDDLGSDVPTPSAVDGRVYVVGDSKTSRGLVSCLDINTGKTIWETQLPKSRLSFSSSPLVAGDHLYVTQENATTYVIGPLSSDSPKVVSVNELGDSDQFTVASPIPVKNSLLLRSRHHLYRLE